MTSQNHHNETEQSDYEQNQSEGSDPDVSAVDQTVRQEDETFPDEGGLDSDPDDDLAAARTEIQNAARHAEGDARTNLLSVDEGLMELTEGDKVEAEHEHRSDRFAELERKLDGLITELDGAAKTHTQTATDHLGSYRREYLE